MENTAYVHQITNEFIRQFKQFRSTGIITVEDLANHAESNAHSWLQSIMLKSGDNCGLISIPEIKIKFKERLRYRDVGVTTKKTEARQFIKVDAAFYDNNKTLRGLAEIYTMDAAHGALKSSGLPERSWVTPRDIYLHLADYSTINIEFVIIVAILLKKANRIEWPVPSPYREILEHGNDYYSAFKQPWQEMKSELMNRQISTNLLIINEDYIEQT